MIETYLLVTVLLVQLLLLCAFLLRVPLIYRLFSDVHEHLFDVEDEFTKWLHTARCEQCDLELMEADHIHTFCPHCVPKQTDPPIPDWLAPKAVPSEPAMCEDNEGSSICHNCDENFDDTPLAF